MQAPFSCKLHNKDRGSVPGPAKVEFGRFTCERHNWLASPREWGGIVLRIIRSTRTAEGRGYMQCILANVVNWNRWSTIGKQIGRKREKSDKKYKWKKIASYKSK